MSWDALEKADSALLRGLGPSALRTVIGHARDAWPGDAILRVTPGAETLLDVLDRVDRSAGLAYLTGLAAGYVRRRTLPGVHAGPGGQAAHRAADRAVLGLRRAGGAGARALGGGRRVEVDAGRQGVGDHRAGRVRPAGVGGGQGVAVGLAADDAGPGAVAQW